MIGVRAEATTAAGVIATTQQACTVGVGLRTPHLEAAVAAPADGLWFEVHAENYLLAGGPRMAALAAIRGRFELSVHGVGLSLAADAAPEPAHLRRLVSLVEQMRPSVVSEHLAWSQWRGRYRPDLLPVPRSWAALERIAANVASVQDALGRQILIENPAHYLRLSGHDCDEIDFLARLADRTGCGLLLDVNNVYVAGNNLGYDATAYIDAFPGELVGEVHLAGFSPDPVHGARLLIDSHAAPVDTAVLALYARLIARIGPRPTLIERDAELPPFADLLAERTVVDALLAAAVARA